MKKLIPPLFLLFTLLLSCSKSGEKTPTLTSEKIEGYLNAYVELKKQAPEMLKQANSGNSVSQQQGFKDFETITKKNGLSYKDFVIINAKIGAIYSVLQGESFMEDMKNMKEGGMVQMDEGMKQIQAQIDDPNTPEEAKAELRKALEEMKAAKEKINSEYNKNKEWADLVMDKTKQLTNLYIDKDEAELVKKYKDKITEAYTGMAPTNFNVNESGI